MHITEGNRWKTKSRQTEAKMARPDERRYAKKQYARRQKSLACHDFSRHTTKCIEAERLQGEKCVFIAGGYSTCMKRVRSVTEYSEKPPASLPLSSVSRR